jgi:hypothetical protein
MGDGGPSGVPPWFGFGVGIRVLALVLAIVVAWAVLLGAFVIVTLRPWSETSGEEPEPDPPTAQCGAGEVSLAAQFGTPAVPDGLIGSSAALRRPRPTAR